MEADTFVEQSSLIRFSSFNDDQVTKSMDLLSLLIGVEILKISPSRVSTEVDAR